MVREAPQQEGKGFRSGAILSRNSHWPKCEALCGQTTRTIGGRTDWQSECCSRRGSDVCAYCVAEGTGYVSLSTATYDLRAVCNYLLLANILKKLYLFSLYAHSLFFAGALAEIAE